LLTQNVEDMIDSQPENEYCE